MAMRTLASMDRVMPLRLTLGIEDRPAQEVGVLGVLRALGVALGLHVKIVGSPLKVRMAAVARP